MGIIQSLFDVRGPSAPLTFAEALREHTLTMCSHMMATATISNGFKYLEFDTGNGTVTMATERVWAPGRYGCGYILPLQNLYLKDWESIDSILPGARSSDFYLRFLTNHWFHAEAFVNLYKNGRKHVLMFTNTVVYHGDCVLCKCQQCDCKIQLAVLDSPRWLAWCTVVIPHDLVRAVGYKMISLICDLLG